MTAQEQGVVGGVERSSKMGKGLMDVDSSVGIVWEGIRR